MDTSKIVGEKIKSLRESQSISIEQLAERSGLAVEQIERIEKNIDLPSLAPLIKIARVLGVRLGTFLDDQDETGPAICRKTEAKDTISFSNNAIQSRKHMEYHSCPKQRPTVIWSLSSLTWLPRKTVTLYFLRTKEKNSSWSWKASWKSATARIHTCSKKGTAFIMILSFPTTYMLTKAKRQKFLQ